MIHTSYFLIEPKEVAQLAMPSRVPEYASLLLDPLLTSRTYSDRSIWREGDLQLAVKLSFLAMLREYDFLRSPSASFAILGSEQLTEELFDQWWSIRTLHFEEASEQMEAYLAAVIDQTPPTKSQVVNDWLHNEFRNAGREQQ